MIAHDQCEAGPTHNAQPSIKPRGGEIHKAVILGPGEGEKREEEQGKMSWKNEGRIVPDNDWFARLRGRGVGKIPRDETQRS